MWQGSRSSASLASKRNFLIAVAILCLIQRFAVVNAQYNSDGCEEGEFDCGSHCIPKDRVCDGTDDCDDGIDEDTCSKDCHSEEFECLDGTCIELDLKCDGRYDCPTGEDEQGCEDEGAHDFRCTDDEFQCPDQCINKASVCDGFIDCSDGSDEDNCHVEPEGCSENQFRCSNGLCIEKEGRCNGYHDCIDGSDEKECDSCAGDSFHCHSGECIASAKRCDGEQDCEDLSDEGDCEPVQPLECGPTQFLCDGLCFDESQRCDGHFDCIDRSDEEGCPVEPPRSCPELTCPDGTCYTYVEKCDNHYQCSDGTDERDCRCAQGEFQCANLQCVPESARCNQAPDCRDQSDEWNCPPVPAPTAPPSCHHNEFQCRSGECIPNYKRCDNQPDCADYSDEYSCAEFRGQTGPAESVPSFNLRTYPNDQIIKERQIREGREVVFQCRDEGPNRARVRWTRGPGRKLPIGSRDINGRLEIPNIRVSDSGVYYCEADGYPTTLKGAVVTVNLVVERFNRSEHHQPAGCGPHEATCMNGNCIPRSAICDGNYDCPDGSDESSCSKTYGCEPNEFKCRNNKCVLKTWRCDGQNDCIDNSDEENCATLGPDAPCRYDEFQCRSGQCIPKTYQCDQQSDCLDNSDEIGCAKPTVLAPPPARVNLKVGSVFSITCRAIGFPVPIVTWRLNWNNVPEKCVQTSEDGVGTLTCADIQVRDSGAYSCEVINSVGQLIVSPDTILVVDGDDVCHSGSFNSKAARPEECISCFCFGVSNQCSSADLFIYSIPPQVQSLNVVGVDGPWAGVREITVSEFKEHDLIATRRGVQLRLSDIPLSQQLPYYALPENYQGNQLKSYGGWFKYNVQYTGHGAPNDAPDVILIGNKYTLSYRGENRLESGREHRVSVQFAAGNWYKSDGQLATREELMMTLANTENLLIKLQYVDHVQREVELTNIEMDSAAVSDRGLGSAHLVEECRCPSGYTGLSCEQCAHGYVRQKSGAWLGRCVREEVATCRPGTYGDPSRGISCQPCPCPLTTPSNNFAPTCRLAADGEVICDCNRGYTGRRCETCDRGFVGNPLVPGDSCRPAPPPSRCNEVGTEYERDGYCHCKPNVVGTRCDQCAVNTFHLNWNAAGGCTECFCMGITKECTSSTLYRQSIQTSLGGHYDEDLSIIYNFDNPEVASTRLAPSPQNREVVFRNPRTDDQEVYYWSLSTRFVGNKLTSYGGLLNYTLRFTPVPSASMSRNNAPDVVIKSENDITILHYRRDEVNPRGAQTYSVPIVETQWQRQDGQVVNREHLLMTLAQVSYIFIKATYTTMTEEAALSHVSLDIAGDRQVNYDAIRAVEVEQCSCPLGHTGLSCESCSPGYKRSHSGIYLNVCEKCECNGHSDECDPETGVCLNCRHETTGDNCELCIRGGNATMGTPYDCESDSLTGCHQCESAGTSSCDDRGCICKPNVEGSRCQNCRSGTFSLSQRNPMGCSECFCSGVSTTCQAGRFYREEIPMSVFAEDYAIVNRDNEGADHQIEFDFDTNRLTFNNDYDDNNYYWRLPSNFLGKQLNSYGANLTYVLESVGTGDYTRGDDVIIRGNGQVLVWERRQDYFTGNEVIVPFLESEWKKADRSGSRHVTRFDLLTALSNIDSILIRGTIHEENTQSRIGGIILGTAVPVVTGSSSTMDIEVCQCPPGYTGASCETCDALFYRDVDDRSKSLAGACQRCPCSQNAESCELDSNRRVVCNCKPSFYGDRCDDTIAPTQRPPLPPGEPQISVTISSNLLQIIEVGQTIRVNCTGRHIISNTPLATRWFKLHGRFSPRVYEDRGTLIITDSQIDDSGIYVCQGKDGVDVVEEKISITIGDVPTRPVVRVNPQTVTTDEGAYVEVNCDASGIPQPDVYWERSDGYPLDRNVVRDQRDQRILRFTAVRKSDEGQYRCIGRNSAGYSEDVLTLIVRAESPVTRPPSPTVHINPDYYNGGTGDEVRLSCISNDVGATSIRWSKDRTVALPHYIIVNPDGLLVIRSASYEDSGRYVCTVTTYTGVSMTSSVEVHINSDQSGGGGGSTTNPRINPLQTNHLVVQGTDFTLPCIASGSPQPRIKWTKLHENFDVNTRQVGNALVITNAQVVNRGVYICSAETDDGVSDQASTIVEIDQRQAPEIEIHPLEPQVIRIGGQAMLSCRSIIGIPNPKIVWERLDGRTISHRFQEQYEGTLILSNATMEDGGSYVCRGRNIVGEVSKTTTITVEEPPRLTLEPNTEQLEITEGDELVLSCFGSGTPQPSVEWKTPQQTLVAGIGSTRTQAKPFAKVQIFRASNADSGLYTCVGSSSAGTEHRYVQVIVKPKRGDVGPHDDDEDYRPGPPYTRPTANPYPDYGTYHTTPYKVGLGDSATLDCNVVDSTGTIGRPTDWRRVDNRPLPSNSINYDGRLVIERVDYDAAGQYECFVIDGGRPTRVGAADVIIVEMPRITFSPEMPMTVRSGDHVRILCNVTGEQPIRVSWHMANRYQPLPRTVEVDGSYLIFNSITQSDQGRYSCSAENVHGNITKDAEVLVNNVREVVDRNPAYNKIEEVTEGDSVAMDCRAPQGPRGLTFAWHREGGGIPHNSYYDDNRLVLTNIRSSDEGRYVCRVSNVQGATSENYVDVRVKPHHSPPNLKLEPSRSFLQPGDSITVECISSAGPHAEIFWEGIGGSSLPHNFRAMDNRLVITNADVSNTGRYTCKSFTEDNTMYSAEYELNVEDAPLNTEKRPPKVEHAEVRSTVVLRCNSHLYPATFHWSKDQGAISPEQDVTSSELRLIEVQASDAGTYVCRSTHNGQSVDIPTILVVTGAIPYFPQAPVSYMSFPKMEDVFHKFNFEITFKPERPDGILLYNGQRRGAGDFVALSLNEGYVEFRLDLGKQPIIVKSRTPLAMGEWHTVQVNRVRKDGYVIVDNEDPVPFPSHLRFQGLELEENLYLGGVPKLEDLAPHSSSPRSGYVGCVSRLVLGTRELSLKKDFLHQEGVTSCEPCADDPCSNKGVCLESQSLNGFSCVCAAGFTGSTCDVTGISCSVGACGSGSCLNTEKGMQCLCPVNRTGEHCEVFEPLDPARLEFQQNSYAAYKAPRSGKFHLEFSFLPVTDQDGLLVYMAESEQGIGDFASVAIKDKHLEVRFNTMTNNLNPVVIRSEKPIELNKWAEVNLGRRHSEGYLQVNKGAESKIRTAGMSKALSIKTPLFIGGRPHEVVPNRGVGMNGASFRGRIANLKISAQPVEMVAGLKGSANLRNFKEGNNDPSNYELPLDSDCPLGYGGQFCDEIIDLCLAKTPCVNGGTCHLVNGGDDTICDCPIGYSGESCELSSKIEYAVHMKGNGYIELDRALLANSSYQNNTELAIMFSTLQPNGLLVWYGPETGEAFEGQDFMSVSVRNGHVELAYRLDGEETVITNEETQVDDGARHVLIVKRNYNEASLEVDTITELGETRPRPRKISYLPGNIFIGGAPNLAVTTGGRMTQGFQGCVHVVEPTIGGPVDLGKKARSGVNVASCPSFDYREGTEPPVV